VLTSEAVRLLTTGAGIQFQDRGQHELKGVPDSWHLHAAMTRSRAAPTSPSCAA
jgi:hypothetical protein